MHIIPEALNILDDSNMPQIAALRKNCYESVVGDYNTSYDVCCKIMNYIEDVSGGVYAYDQRIFGADWDPIEQVVTDYFSAQPQDTLDQIQKDIHVYPHDTF